jgi:hypothetical protein
VSCNKNVDKLNTIFGLTGSMVALNLCLIEKIKKHLDFYMKRLLVLLLGIGTACGSPNLSGQVTSIEKALQALQVKSRRAPIVYVFGGPSLGHQLTLSQKQLKRLSRKLRGKKKKKNKKKS